MTPHLTQFIKKKLLITITNVDDINASKKESSFEVDDEKISIHSVLSV